MFYTFRRPPCTIVLHLSTYCNRVAKLVQHVVHNNVAMCCVEMFGVFGWALTSSQRGSSTRAFNAQNAETITPREFHDHTSRVPNLMETIFPRRFDVHVRLLHFLGFFLFNVRKPLAFGAYNLIVAISNQSLFFLKTNEAKHVGKRRALFYLLTYQQTHMVRGRLQGHQEVSPPPTSLMKIAASFSSRRRTSSDY